MQSAAGLGESAGTLQHRQVLARVGDYAQDAWPGLEQAELDGPARPGRAGRGCGRAWDSALASSSDTTTAMSLERSATPHRRTVAVVKARAAGTAWASAPGVRMATRGKHVHCQGAGLGVRGQFPLISAAVSMAGRSHRDPSLTASLAVPVARIKGCAIIVWVNPALTGDERYPYLDSLRHAHACFQALLHKLSARASGVGCAADGRSVRAPRLSDNSPGSDRAPVSRPGRPQWS